MKIKRDGLVYRLATYFDGDEPKDFCALVRAVVWRSTMILFFCVVFGSALGDFIAWGLSVIINGWIPVLDSFGATSFLIIAAFLAVVTLAVSAKHSAVDSESKIGEAVRFVSTAYAAKKNKFCPKVEIK